MARGRATLAAATAAAACASLAAAHVGAHNEFEMLRPETIQPAPQWMQDETNCTIAVPEPANRTISSGGVVTVTWSCASLPPGAWIGAYSPPPADLNALRNSYPVRMTKNLDTWAGTPSGSVRMRFGNYRRPLQFFLMSGGNVYPPPPCCPLYFANSSTLIEFADPNEPVRPRLMVVGDSPDQAHNLRVMWGTFNVSGSEASADFAQELKNSTERGYFVGWPSNVTTVTRDQLFNAPANGSGFTDLGHIHSVDIDLSWYLDAAARNRTLYMRLGEPRRGVWLSDIPFVIPPPPGAAGAFNPLTGGGQPMTLAIFGDYGRGSADDSETWVEYGRPAINTTARLRELAGLAGNTGAAATLGGRTASAVWVIGDLSYANGILTVWDSYLDMTAQFAGSLPMISLLGNHELNSPGDPGNTFFNPTTANDGGGEGGVLAQALTPMPRGATRTRGWFGLSMGLVRLIGLSTDQDFTTGSPQWLWLRDELASVNRSLTPWVVLAAHRPMYIDSTDTRPVGGDQPVAALMRQHLEPLVWQYQVNLALYGHNHAVQRHSAAYGGRVVQASVATVIDGEPARLQLNPQATVHYVVGNGGATFTRNAAPVPPAYSEQVQYEYGLGTLTVYNATHLQWRVLENTAGASIDNLWIVRTDGATAPWKLPWDADAGGGGGSGVAVVVGAVCGALAGLGLLGAAVVLAVKRPWANGWRGADGSSGAGTGAVGGGVSASSLTVKVDNPAAAAAAAQALGATMLPGGGAPPVTAAAATDYGSLEPRVLRVEAVAAGVTSARIDGRSDGVEAW